MNFLYWLTLLLVALKLVGYFPYSWWLVFTPLYVSAGITLIVVLAALVATLWGER